MHTAMATTLRLLPYYCGLLGPIGSVVGILVPLVGFSVGGLLCRTAPVQGLGIAVVTGAISCFVFWRLRPFAESLRIASTGRPGRAELLAIHDTGTTINKAILVEMLLRVKPTVGSNYEVQVREPVPRVAVGRLIPNTELPIMIDTKAPGKVTLRPEQKSQS